MIRGQFFEHNHTASTQQSRIQGEWWILSGRTNQCYCAALNVRQENVLLQFVESMDFVHEQNRFAMEFLLIFGHGNRLLDLSNAGHGRWQFHETAILRFFAFVGYDVGECGLQRRKDSVIKYLFGCSKLTTYFSNARRSPQNHTGHFILVEYFAQHRVFAHYMALANVIVNGFWAHFLSQRHRFLDHIVFCFGRCCRYSRCWCGSTSEEWRLGRFRLNLLLFRLNDNGNQWLCEWKKQISIVDSPHFGYHSHHQMTARR